MVMTKDDYVFVDEKMSKVQISCGCDAVKITLFNAYDYDWQAVAYFRRADPDLRALAEALLACCEEDGNDEGGI